MPILKGKGGGDQAGIRPIHTTQSDSDRREFLRVCYHGIGHREGSRRREGPEAKPMCA